jgi:NADH-quinone oxidoreductase subunit J
MLNILLTLSLLGAAIGVLLCRQTIYALLSLIVVFLTSSLYFILQGVNFVGLILIIVYIGAIAMLFLYMTMLINSPNDYTGNTSLLSDIVSVCVIWLAVRGFQAASTIKSDQDNID